MNQRLKYAIITTLSIASVSLVVLRRTQETLASSNQSKAHSGGDTEKTSHRSPQSLTPSPAPVSALNSSTKSADAGSNAPSVTELTESFRTLPTQDLKEKLDELKQRLEDEEWIERANNGSLSADARNQLEEILNTETAAKIVLLERDIARIKGKYL